MLAIIRLIFISRMKGVMSTKEKIMDAEELTAPAVLQ